MRIECVHAVQKAIGREISQAEARGIEEKVIAAQRRLAARNPREWVSMPRDARLRAAAEAVTKDMLHEVDLKETRAALTLEAHARHVPDVERAGTDAFKAITTKLRQAEFYVKGTQRELQRQILDAIDFATTHDTGSLVMRGVRWISNLENPQKTLAFVREMFGVDTGDAGAKAAAKAWRDGIEAARVRFNEAGGDIRKLFAGYLPQPHDAGRILQAGLTRWVQDVLPMLDRQRYYSEAGRQLNDTELSQMLEEAWRTITSEGWSKVEPGQFRGEGALADAGSQARVIHFNGPDAYVQYLAKYGQGTVFDAMSSHIGWMARNIGLVEQFGPNPDALFRTMHDTALQQAGRDRDKAVDLKVIHFTTEDAWRLLSGEVDRVQNYSRAAFHQNVRNVEVFGKLQQATISALTDLPSYLSTLGYNRLGLWQGAVHLVRAFGSDAEHFANVAGLIAEGRIGDMRQWGDDRLGASWTRALANATMKASLLNMWTDSIRRATHTSMMAGLARISRIDWNALESGDRGRLERKGWQRDEWQLLQQVTPERWHNTDMLTPRAVAAVEGADRALRDRTISRLLGTIADEGEFGSIAPDLRTRLVTTGALQRGSGTGELWRHSMLFKGFGLGTLMRHWDRFLNGGMTPAGKVAYSSTMILGSTLMGALVLQLKDLFGGRDPRDMTGAKGDNPAQAVKFWAAAMAQGGGLGIVGDMLLTATGRQGQSAKTAAINTIAGPVAGSAFELFYDVGLENLLEAAKGKDTHAAAEAFRWARGHLPATNLWYAKLAIDQAALNELQEFLSPGFLSKVRERAAREWGSSYWWAPTGDNMQPPERAPDLARALGE